MYFTKGYRPKALASFIRSINKITYSRSIYLINDTKNHETRLLNLIRGLILFMDSHDFTMKKLKMEFNKELVLGKPALSYI